MINLTSILPSEAIRLGVQALDWQGAIRLAGELLVTAGTTAPEYTEANGRQCQAKRSLHRRRPRVRTGPCQAGLLSAVDRHVVDTS